MISIVYKYEKKVPGSFGDLSCVVSLSAADEYVGTPRAATAAGQSIMLRS